MDFFNNDWAMPREGDLDRKVSVPNLLAEEIDWDTAVKRKEDVYTKYDAEDYYYDYDSEEEPNSQ